MTASSPKVFRDPVHNLISFDGDDRELVLSLVDTPEFQRLRRIRQTGLSALTFHGAEHSRFTHSLRACYVAKRMLASLEASVHRSTVLRDIHRAGASLWDRSPVGPVRVLGADETVVRMRGRAVFLGFVVDAKTGTTVGVDILLERDSQAFLDWLGPYVEHLGVQVLVTDDLNTYKPVAEELGIRHQVCLAHVRKWVTNRLKKVEGWEEEKALIQQLVRELPQDGGALLLRLERRVQRSPPLRRLIVDLVQRWPALVCHQRVAGVPVTNNRTEQAIGKSKVRFKTVRGFKSPLGAMAGVALTQWLYSGAEEHDLAELAA